MLPQATLCELSMMEISLKKRAHQIFTFDSSKAYSICPTAGDILVYKMPNGVGEIV